MLCFDHNLCEFKNEKNEKKLAANKYQPGEWLNTKAASRIQRASEIYGLPFSSLGQSALLSTYASDNVALKHALMFCPTITIDWIYCRRHTVFLLLLLLLPVALFTPFRTTNIRTCAICIIVFKPCTLNRNRNDTIKYAFDTNKKCTLHRIPRQRAKKRNENTNHKQAAAAVAPFNVLLYFIFHILFFALIFHPSASQRRKCRKNLKISTIITNSGSECAAQ